MNDVITVLCMVFPDGTIFWAEEGQCDPDKVIEVWRAGLPSEKLITYDRRHVCGGFVQLRMLREDYQAIPATSTSAALFEAARK